VTDATTGPSLEQEVARLKSLMWKKSFYVMTRRTLDPAKLAPNALAHYRWIIELEKQGMVFASGPLFRRGEMQGVGMTIFRVDTWEQAEALALADPFYKSGAMTFDLMLWQVNEGRMSIRFDFSDMTFQAE
jgi:uncharacterized protein YciI